MKQFFMVNKDVKFKNEQQEWTDVSLEDLREAAEIDEDVKSVKLFSTLEDAQAAALDGVDFDEETDFFPIFVVNVADHVKGRKAKYALENGLKLNAISIKPEQIESVESAYLDHIDAAYDDVNFPSYEAEEEQELESSSDEEKEELDIEIAAQAEEVEEELEVAAQAAEEAEEEELEASDEEKPEEPKVEAAPIMATKPSRLAAMSQYVPSSKALVKNGLAIGATGAAYYFGNEAVVDLATKASVVVPEMLAASAALPLVVGTTARLATEVPELAAKGAKLAANSKVAATASAKAAPVVERVAPYVPSTKNLVKNGFAVAAGAVAFYFGNAEVVSLVAQTGLALPEVIATSAFLPAAVVASARLVTELPEISVKAASFIGTRSGQLIDLGKEWWNTRRNAAPSKAPVSPEAGELKERLKELTKKVDPAKDAESIQVGPAITTAHKTRAAEAKFKTQPPVVDSDKKSDNKISLH